MVPNNMNKVEIIAIKLDNMLIDYFENNNDENFLIISYLLKTIFNTKVEYEILGNVSVIQIGANISCVYGIDDEEYQCQKLFYRKETVVGKIIRDPVELFKEHLYKLSNQEIEKICFKIF